jgi:peptide alpha-N-acetyltransferase
LAAEYLLKLGKNQDAEKQYRELIAQNSENRSYHLGLQAALGVTKGNF